MSSFSIYSTINASNAGQAIVSVSDAIDNYVSTFSGTNSLIGEPNLTFDGNNLTVMGDIILGNSNSITLSNDGTLEIDVASQLGGTNTLKFPANATGILSNNGSGNLSWINDPTTGDVTGPGAVTTLNQIALFSDGLGNAITNSDVVISSGEISGITSLKLTNNGTMEIDIDDQSAGTNTLTIPANSAGALLNNGSGTLSWSSSVLLQFPTFPFVTGNIPVYFDTGGSIIRMSSINITTQNLTGVKQLGLDGSTSGTITIIPTAVTTNHSITLPADNGTGHLNNNGSGTLTWVAPPTGDVVGPGSATNNAITRFDTSTGKLIQNSSVIISDSAEISGVLSIQLKSNTNTTFTFKIENGGDTNAHNIIFPNANASGHLKNDGAGNLDWGAVPLGDVVGPGSATDNAIARFNLTTGKLLQNSSVVISDSAQLTGVKELQLDGSTSGTLTILPNATTTPYIITMPPSQSNGLLKNTSGALSWDASYVVGPGSATADAIVVYDTSSGKLIKNSAVTIDSSTVVASAFKISNTGTLTFQSAAQGTQNYTYTFPAGNPGANTFLTATNGTGTLAWNSLPGYIIGPASATNNAIARFDLTTGKLLQNSGVTISDSNEIAAVASIQLTANAPTNTQTVTISRVAGDLHIILYYQMQMHLVI